MTRLFLSGPMTGYPGHNFAAFDEAKHFLEKRGYDVVSPSDIAREQGYTVDSPEPTDAARRTLLLLDLAALLSADGVALLRFSQGSRGAQAEMSVAVAANIPVDSVSHWLEIAYRQYFTGEEAA